MDKFYSFTGGEGLNSKVFAYVRVSSKDQNEERQINRIKEYCSKNGLTIDDRDIYIDKESGKDFNRNEYQMLKRQLRKGDTIIISELDRLGRNMGELKQEWVFFATNNIDIVVLENELISTKEKSDLEKRLISTIVFELLAYLAEKERQKIKERQRQGIEIAKNRGKKFGRPSININTLNKEQLKILEENFNKFNRNKNEREITAEEFRKKLALKRTTFYKIIKEYKKILNKE